MSEQTGFYKESWKETNIFGDPLKEYIDATESDLNAAGWFKRKKTKLIDLNSFTLRFVHVFKCASCNLMIYNDDCNYCPDCGAEIVKE